MGHVIYERSQNSKIAFQSNKLDRMFNIPVILKLVVCFEASNSLKMLTIGESSADKFITTILYISGLWFHKKPSLAYRIHSFFVLFVVLLLWIIWLDIGFILSQNLVEATYALSVALPTSVCFAKAMNLYVNNKGIQVCLARVHNFRLLDDEEKKLANRQLSVFFKFTVFFAVACNATITFICWRVVVVTEPELPFTAWYPFLDWQHNNRDFWIVQQYQFYGMLVAVNINIACELFPNYFLTTIACQLEILGMRLEKLNSGREEKSKIVEKLIDDNVQTHYYIMNLTENFQNCYNFQFFVEICTVGICCTSNLFQLAFSIGRSKSLGVHDIYLYVHYVTVQICTIFRIFLPCYFGNLVLSASEALRFRLYSSDWLDMSILCRRKLITFMERTKRSTVIWAWILFPLTLEIFKSIMNFSYSMLTLLQNVN